VIQGGHPVRRPLLKRKNVKISIAMAVYNGAEYLQAQLDSICAQTRLPDEVVICDDCSSDATLTILSRFAATSPFKVDVLINQERLGYARNFERAITLCHGDIIFLCDQDDVWYDTKLERVIGAFKADETAWVVVNDAELTDADLKPTGLTVAGQLLSAGLSTEQLLLGCCIAFRSELTPLISPVPFQLHGHDGWINTLGSTLQCRYFEPAILQLYRRHGGNTSAWVTTRTRSVSRWHLLREQLRWRNIRSDPRAATARRLEQLKTLKDRIASHKAYLQATLPAGTQVERRILEIEQEQRGNEARLRQQQLPFAPRLVRTTRFFLSGGYRQFEGWKSLVRDIIG
jgi:glycosyltransferase involved in cell wall biosynthesis